jgi:hypothetical protein
MGFVERAPLVDYGNVPDVFCSGIARIDRLGGNNFRFIVYAEEFPEGGGRQWVTVGRLIWPLSALASAIKVTSDAITAEPVMIEAGGRLVRAN